MSELVCIYVQVGRFFNYIIRVPIDFQLQRTMKTGYGNNVFFCIKMIKNILIYTQIRVIWTVYDRPT